VQRQDADGESVAQNEGQLIAPARYRSGLSDVERRLRPSVSSLPRVDIMFESEPDESHAPASMAAFGNASMSSAPVLNADHVSYSRSFDTVPQSEIVEVSNSKVCSARETYGESFRFHGERSMPYALTPGWLELCSSDGMLR